MMMTMKKAIILRSEQRTYSDKYLEPKFTGINYESITRQLKNFSIDCCVNAVACLWERLFDPSVSPFSVQIPCPPLDLRYLLFR